MKMQKVVLMGLFSLTMLINACGDDGGSVLTEDSGMTQCPMNPCVVAGAICDGDTLVACTEDLMGCLIEERTDCAATGGSCDDSADLAVCLGDPCAGLANSCDTAGMACSGDTLQVCAANADGCLVQEDMDCTAMPGGFCDPDTNACDADICRGLDNRCEAAGSACDGDNLVVCAADDMGCLVQATTDCTTTGGERCRTVEESPVCVDPCTLVTVCPAESYCDGSDQVTCAADADGCVVETDRTTCALGSACDASGATLECVDRSCPDADMMVLDCDSTMGATMPLMAETVMGTTTHDRYSCEDYSYMSPQRIYRFADTMAADVEISVSWMDRANDMDLHITNAGDGSAVCDEMATCVDSSAGTSTTETVNFESTPSEVFYVSVDRYAGTASDVTVPFTLTVTCTRPVCGDSMVGAGETCDDGNTMPADGCSDTCALEMGYVCPMPGMPCEIACGNGRVDTDIGETCDDMGTMAGDGCAADCTLEMGYACYGEPSMCEIACGNGRVDMDLGETCDDMGTMAGDGCAADCTTEAGYACTGEPSVCGRACSASPCSLSALGGSFAISGAIESTDPTWARPSDSCRVYSWTSSTYHHDSHAIVNDTGADASITITAAWGGDGYLHAFRDPFDASMSATGCITGSDDFGGTRGSQVMVDIPAGATIHAIPSTFSAGSTIGPYTLTIAPAAP